MRYVRLWGEHFKFPAAFMREKPKDCKIKIPPPPGETGYSLFSIFFFWREEGGERRAFWRTMEKRDLSEKRRGKEDYIIAKMKMISPGSNLGGKEKIIKKLSTLFLLRQSRCRMAPFFHPFSALGKQFRLLAPFSFPSALVYLWDLTHLPSPPPPPPSSAV